MEFPMEFPQSWLRSQSSYVIRQLGRYLPHDKDLAEEATSRFQHWLKAPERQDVLPDDLKTSMFKSLGVQQNLLAFQNTLW